MSQEKVGTQAFAEAVIARLGQQPEKLKAAHYQGSDLGSVIADYQRPHVKKELVGVDVFLDWAHSDPNAIGKQLEALNDTLVLKMITNRGVKVYPDGFPETFCTDHWRCRFISHEKEGVVTPQDIIQLLQRIDEAGLDFIKTEGLYRFDGVNGFSVAQGE